MRAHTNLPQWYVEVWDFNDRYNPWDPDKCRRKSPSLEICRTLSGTNFPRRTMFRNRALAWLTRNPDQQKDTCDLCGVSFVAGEYDKSAYVCHPSYDHGKDLEFVTLCYTCMNEVYPLQYESLPTYLLKSGTPMVEVEKLYLWCPTELVVQMPEDQGDRER